ncbi:MAG: hypothetical protein AAF483_16685, partial [Planctomycetota bacterium]
MSPFATRYNLPGEVSLLGNMMVKYDLAVKAIFSWLVLFCQPSVATTQQLSLLSTEELQAMRPEATGGSCSVAAELLTREIGLKQSKELFTLVISSCTPEEDPECLAKALAAKSIYVFRENPEQAKKFAMEAEELAASCNDDRAAAFALFAHARHDWLSRDWKTALRKYRKLFEFTNLKGHCSDFQIRALNGMGSIAMIRGTPESSASNIPRH